MIKFHLRYFLWAALLFIVEVIIALYIDDQIIRPYFGDFLVVIFLYCFVKSFIRASSVKVALGVLGFSYVIECLQYLKFVKLIGLQHSYWANIVLGNSFEWWDMVAYTLGALFVILVEKIIFKPSPSVNNAG